MKTVAIVQARMGSTRLPGKVMKDLAGEPLLARVLNRLGRSRTLAEVVVATTTQPADTEIIELCRKSGVPCTRGSELDVLDRYYQTAVARKADVVVRITSDCPLIEPAIVDRLVRIFLEGQPIIDYASNSIPKRTFPRGLDAEVMRFDILERAWGEDNNPAWREHVTPYIYNNPELFSLAAMTSDRDCSSMRWTVDEADDLTFVRKIYHHFGNDKFSWREVLSLLEEHPDWQEINRHVEQKVLS